MSRWRPLDAAERAAHPELPREVLERARVVVVRALPLGVAGMTLGRWVLLRHDRADDEVLLAHELVHVAQVAATGLVPFLVRYGRDYLHGLVRLRSHRAAYRVIPAEIEARARAAAWSAGRGAEGGGTLGTR